MTSTTSVGWLPRVLAVLIGLSGMVLGGGGAWLAVLGGSLYYMLGGFILFSSAVMLWFGMRQGLHLYLLFLAATLVWALWEVGFSFWGLMPRLALFIGIGALFLIPAARRGLAAIALIVAGGLMMPTSVQAAGEEWPVYGGDQASTRYSTLEQLTPDNVGGLQEAWRYQLSTEDKPTMGLQVTPLMVNGTLYLCTPYNEIIALDPETGAEKWRFDRENARFLPRSCRGVTYVETPDATDCPTRILTATTDARLIAVHAETGEPCIAFGDGGATDLSFGMGQLKAGYYYVSSPPTLIRGNVVLGGWVSDNQHIGEPSGVIRAYNATTGAFAWAWDLGRPGHYGLPPEGETYTRGTPNSWAPASTDEELGLVYLPMGNATPDHWGAHRSEESEKFASSVVALNGETGEPVWVFQTVHHDVWDYDVGSPPTLVDVEVDGEMVPALLQPTKQGQIYLLDRRTGEPLADVEERPVPQGAAPGDYLSPTQPFSVGMPNFEDRALTEQDMWGLTPFDQLYCRIKFRQARYEGPMTPPGLKPTITYPGYMGGMEWGGVAIDPNQQLMVVNWSRVPNYSRLVPRKEAEAMGVKAAAEGISPVGKPAAQEGTPFAIDTNGFLSLIDVPCISPPWGLITLVDLKARQKVWERPLGTGEDSGPWGISSGIPIEMGVPNLGGSVVTKSGLIFIAATMEHAFRALELKTGEELWKVRLPAAGHATPMTYVSPESGRQFVVTVAAGHFALGGLVGDAMSDHIIAYALPDGTD